jgi:hypothetical protein
MGEGGFVFGPRYDVLPDNFHDLLGEFLRVRGGRFHWPKRWLLGAHREFSNQPDSVGFSGLKRDRLENSPATKSIV